VLLRVLNETRPKVRVSITLLIQVELQEEPTIINSDDTDGSSDEQTQIPEAPIRASTPTFVRHILCLLSIVHNGTRAPKLTSDSIHGIEDMTYEEFLAEIDDLLTTALRLPFDKIFDAEKTLSYAWLPLARAQAIKEPPYTDLSNAGHFEVLKETLEPYLDDR
jgi:hypothetical protein